MKRFSEQFYKKAEHISLTARERDILRERVTAYMEYHPMTVKSPKSKRIFTESFVEVPFFARYAKGLAAIAMITLVVSVPALAERAIPGDMLYPIKVQVNEEVMSRLATDEYEKIAWETERLERRISEARLLAKEGKLTDAVEADVIAAVQTHQANTEVEIANLRESDVEAAALASLTLASVLDVQSATLKANDTGSTTRGQSTVLLASALDEAQVNLGRTDTTVSADRLVAKLESETTRGRELLHAIEKQATPSEQRELERRLGDIERKVGAARNLATTDAEAGKVALRSTWRDMQVLITFMTDIDVRSTLALESLVPVVLTPEEEQSIARASYENATRQLAIVKEQLPLMPEDGLKEKFVLTIPEVEALLITATTSLQTDSHAAKVAAVTAEAYVRDMSQATSLYVNGLGDGALMMTTMIASGTPTSTATTSNTTVENEEDENESN